MATDLLLPTGLAPSNLHLRHGVTTTVLTSDTFDICERMKHIDTNLFAVQLVENDTCGYAIMEHCGDGIERLVFRTSALDGRVLEKLRYLMAMPLSERLDKLEADEYEAETARQDEASDELYETLGGPMRHEMARCGFTGPLPESYPKLGVTSNGKRAR